MKVPLKSGKDFFRLLYLRLFKINDTPPKVSLGFGLGVFLGIFPGTGPIAALVLASILRLNRASAVIGSLLVNTWLSLVAFLLSVKVGAFVMKIRWQDLYSEWSFLLKDFHWINLLKTSVFKMMLPIFLGYLIISLCAGILAYLISSIILARKNYENKSRIDIPR